MRNPSQSKQRKLGQPSEVQMEIAALALVEVKYPLPRQSRQQQLCKPIAPINEQKVVKRNNPKKLLQKPSEDGLNEPLTLLDEKPEPRLLSGNDRRANGDGMLNAIKSEKKMYVADVIEEEEKR